MPTHLKKPGKGTVAAQVLVALFFFFVAIVVLVVAWQLLGHFFVFKPH